MEGMPTRSAGSSRVGVIAILDPSMDFARLLELLVRERFPASPVRAFTDLAVAEEWIAASEAPVVVIADVDAGDGRAVQVAGTWSSRAGRVRVLALASVDEERTLPPHATPKPCSLRVWRQCLEALSLEELGRGQMSAV